MDFKSWLIQSDYIKQNNPRGDLARDIRDDDNFPIAFEKYVIYKYLFSFLDSNTESYFDKMYDDFIRFISRKFDDEI